ncbi:helix-turn-helix transcriptional regulator [Enterobacter soli]|uniref:helix-turn-helix transcriptional regulator n=1 Tax=Enterobacter soli TaxID=885040 RepID=UPI002F3E7630
MTFIHPGEILRQRLKEKNMNLSEAAKVAGTTKATLSRLISGKQALSASLAVKISILCNSDPLSLLASQNVYDLAILKEEEKTSVGEK